MKGKRIVFRGHRRIGAPGCDDAPVVSVERGPPKAVQFIYPYYENPNMLAYQAGLWSAFEKALWERLSVIVVDDGSPEHPAETVLRGIVLPFPVRLYRIDVDVRWNWLAARNLGMAHAAGGWCLLTDMDHVVSLETLSSVVFGRHDPRTVYRFSRVESDGVPIKPHPNSWLMTRDMFWQIGGYDEALSGYYGTDGEFRRRVAGTAPVRILTDTLVRHEFHLDASTMRYARKQPEDLAVQRLVAARGPDWRPKTLSFPWRAVAL